MITTMLDKIETGDAWPTSLTQVSMTAIPKAESPAVVIRHSSVPNSSATSTAYGQVFRASQAAGTWLPRVLSRHCYGGVRGKSAKSASANDSLLWDLTNAAGEEYRATYLDASRCFDTLRYADLLGVAERAGMGRQGSYCASWLL